MRQHVAHAGYRFGLHYNRNGNGLRSGYPLFALSIHGFARYSGSGRSAGRFSSLATSLSKTGS
jgi:hypothetical protein